MERHNSALKVLQGEIQHTKQFGENIYIIKNGLSTKKIILIMLQQQKALLTPMI